jgi:hypothetical protein
MKSGQKEPPPQWIKELPRSKMRYPTRLRDRAKYVFWRTYTPFHPLLRGTARVLGVSTESFVDTHEGRQNYLLGHIAPTLSLQEFVEHLIGQGFAKFHVAWKDSGETVSLRRVENFTHQYHIRIFADGEVRGHYEFTPECYPFSHLKAVGQEHRPEEFAKLFGHRVVR